MKRARRAGTTDAFSTAAFHWRRPPWSERIRRTPHTLCDAPSRRSQHPENESLPCHPPAHLRHVARGVPSGRGSLAGFDGRRVPCSRASSRAPPGRPGEGCMRGRAHRISRLGRAAMVAALMGATLLATATPSGDPQQATEHTHSAGAPASPTAPGLRVQLDAAGRPIVPPPSSALAPAVVVRTQRPPLVELETPAGGTMLMLDDRFHHHSVARRAPDGTISVDCGRAGAAEGADAGAAPVAAHLPPAACAPSTAHTAEAVR